MYTVQLWFCVLVHHREFHSSRLIHEESAGAGLGFLFTSPKYDGFENWFIGEGLKLQIRKRHRKRFVELCLSPHVNFLEPIRYFVFSVETWAQPLFPCHGASHYMIISHRRVSPSKPYESHTSHSHCRVQSPHSRFWAQCGPGAFKSSRDEHFSTYS